MAGFAVTFAAVEPSSGASRVPEAEERGELTLEVIAILNAAGTATELGGRREFHDRK